MLMIDDGDLPGAFPRTRIPGHDMDVGTAKAKHLTCRIDVAADYCRCPKKILVPDFKRPAVFHADFKESDGFASKRRKKSLVFRNIRGPLINDLSLMFGKDLCERLHFSACLGQRVVRLCE